jgi:hypothetical protein
VILLISASLVARIAGMSHRHPVGTRLRTKTKTKKKKKKKPKKHQKKTFEVKEQIAKVA